MKNAFLLASTGSGCGKTTITCALLKAIKNRNLIPKSYKCGPDYIDPMFHKTVLGIESQNLDLFFSNEREIRSLFYDNNTSDVSIVEGVMGLYDGISPSGNEGSSYDLACKLDVPVVLIVNAKGMGRSLLALIRGFQEMDEENRIKAVILNRISSSYYEIISSQIERELGIVVAGYFPDVENIQLESRYLGLKMPHEIANIENNVQMAAELISKTVNIDKILEISKYIETEKFIREDRENVCVKYATGQDVMSKKVRIGVARDEAFCFYYDENIKLLRKLGADIIEFSPIHDSKLPEELDGLIFGGGYPELYADKLSSNISMLESIKNSIVAGIPSLAECGGFMYLHDSIKVEDDDYSMVGAISGYCEKKDKLVRFGYLYIEEKAPLFMTSTDKLIKGHEFHYYESTNNGKDAISTKPNSNRNWESGHISNNHWWGFAHLYYPSNVHFAESFINICRIWNVKKTDLS